VIGRLFKRTLGWLPATFVLAVTLVCGSRLIVLSMQQHAERARETAQARAERVASDLAQQLEGVTDQALHQARRVDTSNGTADALAGTTPLEHGFWIGADGAVVPGHQVPSVLANSIVSEWASIPARSAVGGASVLGPMREGSQWIVAARVPVLPPGTGADAQPVGWSVTYAELDRLLAAVHLGRLVDAGYDFQVVQRQPGSLSTRMFAASDAKPLDSPVVRSVALAAGFAPAIAGSDLEIVIRPHAGGYPAPELATEIGVLAILAWVLTFGTHDLTHSLRRLQSRLALARQRQHDLSARLSAEIEQRQDLQKSFDHSRYHDGFTGLPNRRYFMNQLDRALKEVRTRQRPRIAVILVDITRFRQVNDTLGHTAGDELMMQAARRFANATANTECVLARWGADQFAVLALDVPAEESALTLADALQTELQTPFELRKHRLSVTASIGLTFVDSAQRAEDVIREADIALSTAKKDETTRTFAYSPAMGGQAQSLVSLEADLHVALANNELRLVFQPIVDLRSYRMVGAEALLRWRHSVEGILTPDRFLATAEEAGLMVSITRRIVLRVCKLAASWRRELPKDADFYLSVNLAAAVLRDQGFAEYVASILRETEVPASMLRFEVTEATLISNVGAARDVLERLHGLGIKLILDDFGTGYSSLNYLQLFPLDFVKIDRPFVSRTGTDHASSGMVAAILQMVPSLGLIAIAEIVETEEAAHALRDMGCEFGQGFFFSKPVVAEIALQLLREQPFTALLHGDGIGSTAVPTAKPIDTSSSSDDTSIVPPLELTEVLPELELTGVMPPLELSDEELAEIEDAPPEKGKRS
jgi:diguanylate cyclase (GGDEF)-like protein